MALSAQEAPLLNDKGWSYNAGKICAETLSRVEEIQWQKSIRSKALESLDQMLSWTFNQEQYVYVLKSPQKEEIFHITSPELLAFPKNYSYFSDEHPIVAKVTDDPEDIKITIDLFKDIMSVKDMRQRMLITGEVIAKVLAYRDLKMGQIIPIPTPDDKLTNFKIDALFDLGNGMPAFGLVPEIKGTTAPLLIFRGTDVSILTHRGLASVISDLDPKGPGHSTFLKTRDQIHAWLAKVAKDGIKAKLNGFSLGGALVGYTYLYEYELINQSRTETSYAFNAPGVTKKVFKEWNKIPLEKRMNFQLFVGRGDLISKIGRLIGDIYEIAAAASYLPIAAHVTLVTLQPEYKVFAVDAVLENQSKRFSR